MIDYTTNRSSYLNVTSNPVNRAHPLNRGMVGWWLGLPQLVGGQTVVDLGGKFNGLITNTVSPSNLIKWTGATRTGGYASLKCDGVWNSQVALPDLSGQFAAREATFSVWVKKDLPNASATVAASGLCYLGGDNGASTHYPYSNGYSYFSIFDLQRPISAITIPNVERWKHLTVTSKAGSGNYKLYVNGALFATGTRYTWTMPATPNLFGNQTSVSATLLGQADDWRLWSRALSDSEVSQLYRESLAGYPTALNRTPLYAARASATTVSMFLSISPLAFSGSAAVKVPTTAVLAVAPLSLAASAGVRVPVVASLSLGSIAMTASAGVMVPTSAAIVLDPITLTAVVDVSGGSTIDTIRKAVYSRLSGLPDVVALAGDRIYPDHPPQNWSPLDGPCVVFTVPTWEPQFQLDGFDSSAVADVEISASAIRRTDALAIERAARVDLVGFSGMIGAVEVDYVTSIGRSTDYVDPVDGGDEGYWTIDCRLEIGYRP